MSLQDLIISIISSATVSVAIVGTLTWLFREWISTRLKSSIQHEYDQKLEAHKARLKAENEVALLELKATIEREAALHAAARSSYSEGQKVAIERKLNAFDKLWDVVMKFRNGLPAILTFVDILTVDQYIQIGSNETLRALASELSQEKITGIATDFFGSIEIVRPYVGEYTWAIFYSYQAIILRMLLLLHWGLSDPPKLQWHYDTLIRGLMEAVLSAEEVIEFDKLQFGKVSWLQRNLEAKILSASRKVISGEEFGTDSLRQAKLIQELAAQSLAKTE